MADPEATLREIMASEVVSVGVDIDQEYIARITTPYDFLALPVLDHSHRLVGIL